ncbi:MAG: acetyl-CoA C-acetyltransferase [Pseudomonadota bacterium]
MDVYIAEARRSPIGKICGALSSISAADLGAQVVSAMIQENDLDPDGFDDVILGQVLTGGAGQNPARQTALAAGISTKTPALTINQVCGAGQRSMHLAAQAISSGDAGLIIAGGQDSMTQAPHTVSIRTPSKMGDAKAKDTVLTDGLIDAFHDIHMGSTVEQLATRFQITRDEQDVFAVQSQAKTASAMQDGKFDAEIVPIAISVKGRTETVGLDEHPNANTDTASLARLKPVFDPEGTITAGNSSGLNDGAAAVIIGNEDRIAQAGLKPLARIVSFASAGVEPMDMGLGPVEASTLALAKAGWSVDDVDLLEINEAFAAQAIAVNKMMGWDTSKLNVNGGAIALGHPLAGSGARLVVTLLHEMMRRDVKRGLASMCIGGGQGVAICLER